MIEIFKGKDNDFSKAVCLNAAAGLIVSEKFTNFLMLIICKRIYFIWKALFTFRKNTKCLKIYLKKLSKKKLKEMILKKSIESLMN